MAHDEIKQRLTETSAAVRAAEQDRAAAVQERDQAIRAARDAGLSWAEIQVLTNLPPDSIRRALRRTS